MHTEYTQVDRQTLETWIELVGGRMSISPRYNSSKIVIDLTVNDVKASWTASAINVTPDGAFYGRDDDWNAVRVPTWPLQAFSFFGKGARSTETWVAARDLHETLTGVESAWEYTD